MGGGVRNVKFTCEGAKQRIFVMFPSPRPMFGIFLASPGDFPVTSGGEKCKIFMRGCQRMHISEVSKPSAYVWNIFQASPGDFSCYKRGGRNVKLICQGTEQCIFVFSSPQHMFGIFLASPGDFPVTSGGGEM